MLKRITNVSIGIFGNFTSLGAHIVFDYMFEDGEIGGFVYKRKPAAKDFQIFSTIFCSSNVFKKFEAELTKLSKERPVNIVHEEQKTLADDVTDLGVQHLYVCHSQRALISAKHISAIKNPGLKQ